MLNWDDPDSISTVDLIEVIGWKGDGDAETEEVAKKAAEIVFYKFGPDLITKCEKLCIKNNRDIADSLKIAQRTIRKFIHAKHFKLNAEGKKNPDYTVKKYLHKVALHECFNLYREEKKIANNPYTGNEGLIYEMHQLEVFNSGAEPIGRLKKYLDLVDHVLKGVNDEHRMIFLTYMDAGVEPGMRPPPHLIKLLMDTTGLTRVTIKGVVNNIRNRIKPIWDVYAKEE